MAADDFKRYFEELSADYRRGLPAKMAELDSLWNALIAGAVLPSRMQDLKRELHTLVGAAKTMGVPEVTDAARVAESFLEPYFERGVVPEAADQAHFRQLLDALMQSAHA